MSAPAKLSEVDSNNALWYLGIDLGTTGISAVLLNASTGQHYPIFWSNELQLADGETHRSDQVMVRLPTHTYSGPAASKLKTQLPVEPIVIGTSATTLAKQYPGIVLDTCKPYLTIGIPYHCPHQGEWQPILQLHQEQPVSLYWVRRTLEALLVTLTPTGTQPDGIIQVGAVSLPSTTLVTALGQLEGVILGYPVMWHDTYRFNLREAVLQAKLVQHPEQIFFLEEAIAPVLALLSNIDQATQQEEPSQTTPLVSLAQNSWQGNILVINAGALYTELTIVNLPSNLQQLSRNDFGLWSVPYAGNAIDQDIFCQLLYPQMSVERQQQLGLEADFDLPQPGQPDPEKRDRLASLLLRSPSGQALLKASSYLKQILQHKDEHTLKLGAEQWTLKRADLEAIIFQPFIEYLNRYLNQLLIEMGVSEQGVYHILCVGGTARNRLLQQWLQQRFPLATLRWDADSPFGNWVAAGLATLPLYPQVLNYSQHQYSDYFLLLELLRAFSELESDAANGVYNIDQIMQQLEYRGLNTSACFDRIVALVEGELPPGLVPQPEDALWLSPSQSNRYYSAVTSTRLFLADGEGFRFNPEQQEGLWEYLDQILANAQQKFEEPLIVKLRTRNDEG